MPRDTYQEEGAVDQSLMNLYKYQCKIRHTLLSKKKFTFYDIVATYRTGNI